MHAVNTRQQASTHKDPEGPPRLCSLQDAAGRIEACSTACPFRDQGGAVLPGGCMLERLGVDLKGRSERVEALLKIRRRLERALAHRGGSGPLPLLPARADGPS